MFDCSKILLKILLKSYLFILYFILVKISLYFIFFLFIYILILAFKINTIREKNLFYLYIYLSILFRANASEIISGHLKMCISSMVVVNLKLSIL